MDKQTVWLDLSDSLYEKRLAEFLERHYGEYLDIHVETVRDAPAVPEKLILLTDEALPKREQALMREGLGRVLLMSPVEGLDPYQSAHEIARAVFRAALEVGKQETEEKRALGEPAEEAALAAHEKRLCVVTATSGGLGGSTLARALAAEWAQAGRTLLLDLSERSSWRLYEKPAETGGDLADLFYSLAAEPESLWEKRLLAACEKQEDAYWAAVPSDDPEDWLSLSRPEVDALCTVLLGAFDTVVADTGHWIGASARHLMEKAHEICVLTSRREEDVLALKNLVLPEGVCWTFFRELPGDTAGKGRGQGLLKGGRGKEEETVFCLPEAADLWSEKEELRILRKETDYRERVREAVKTMG